MSNGAPAASTPLPLKHEQEQEQDRYLVQQREESKPVIYDVTEGLKSPFTKKAYRVAFNHFIDVTIEHRDLGALLDTKQSVVESKIIDHVKYLRDVKQLSYRSILVHLDAIFHFSGKTLKASVSNNVPLCIYR